MKLSIAIGSLIGVAFSVCATCHAVGRGGGASPNAMAPRFADVANWPGMTDRALRIHGGRGYTQLYKIERYYRDARALWFEEGTAEIQRIVIANNFLKNGIDW